MRVRWPRLFALALLTACEFDETITVRSDPIPAVHAVLNPAVNDYVVMVEEVLSGTITIDENRIFDPSDPIRSGGGVPVHDALVVIRNAAGDSAVGRESTSGTSFTGVYYFGNGAGNGEFWLPLVPGERYTLTIATPSGRRVTGATTIPAYNESPVIAPPVFFNRDHDTLRLIWPEVPYAKRYMVRIESPRGPFFFFVDGYRVDVPGGLRNFRRIELPAVFTPGFPQRVLVAAVDTNFYDYYRSANDPFAGRGLINHLEGGVGFFGSMTPLTTTEVRVTADVDEPWEGEFRITGIPGIQNAPPVLWLYQDGEADGTIQLSGNYQRGDAPDPGYLIGTLRSGGQLSLALLGSQSFSDTLATLRGTYEADSLVAIFSATGEQAVYRRR